jgi:hypothetical protein
VARFLAQELSSRLASAIQRVLERIDRPCDTVLTSGEGSFVLQRLISSVPRLKDANVLSLDRALGAEHSRAACSFALARLLRERLSPASQSTF